MKIEIIDNFPEDLLWGSEEFRQYSESMLCWNCLNISWSKISICPTCAAPKKSRTPSLKKLDMKTLEKAMKMFEENAMKSRKPYFRKIGND